MKKILIFSMVYYPNFHGGAEPAIKEITDRISPADIEFHMVTCLWNSKLLRVERVGNVLVHRIGFGIPDPKFSEYNSVFKLKINKYIFQLWGAVKGLQLNAQYHYDGIWAMMAHSAGVPAALFKMCAPRVGFVLTLQEGDPPEHIERVLRPVWPLFTRAFTTADVVQVISSFLGDWARRRGVPESKIELIYNGANPGNLAESYSQEDARRAAERLGKKPGDIYILNASRLVYQKANDDTLRALQYLPTHVHLVLIGDGEDEQKLKDSAAALGLQDRLHLLGRIERTEVPTYRNRTFADIYATPSRSEGLQLSSLSAMAGRLPLIATQEGGLAEYVWDKKHNPDKPKTAWVVDKDSPEQIAAAVKDILAHPEEVQSVTEANREMILEKYNWDNIAKEMRVKVFGRILGT